MKIRFSPWSIALGLLVLLMIAAILGWIPLTPWNIFWIVVMVASVWAIKKIFFSEKRS
jgi:hypothetical protein